MLGDKVGVIGRVAGPHLPLLVRPGRQLFGRIPPHQLVQHVPAVLVTTQQGAVPQRQHLRALRSGHRLRGLLGETALRGRKPAQCRLLIDCELFPGRVQDGAYAAMARGDTAIRRCEQVDPPF